MKCANCGKEINKIQFIIPFTGGMQHEDIEFKIVEKNGCKIAEFLVPDNEDIDDGKLEWEPKEYIQCPKCKKYPFDDYSNKVYLIREFVAYLEE